ncbi:MAG: LysR family transcriptional regulator [Polyangiaceae bacterium]|nr:LysR family transcriptional regulator [Polyangiaceae bacterium]
MHWDDLRYALAIARAGTLSGAAEALGVSHTTVGRRIRALEEGLGVRLFDATPEGFQPTEAGADLVAVAERMETDSLALEGRILGRDARWTGALRVSVMELVFRAFRGAFVSFLERYPGVDLTITATDDAVSLARREADVVLRLTNQPPEGLVGRKVGRLQFAPYAARSLVARIGEEAPLGSFPWIHWDERLNMQWLDAWLAQHAPGASIALRVDLSAAAMHELVAAGVGVQFLACVEGDADPALVRLGPLDPFACRDLWVLTLPELRATPRVRAFTDHMAEQLRGALQSAAP